MNLKEFALAAGVKVLRCDADYYGGTWAYKLESSPNTAYCGYRTEAEAYRGWARDTFGDGPLKALDKLFRKLKKCNNT